MAENKKFGYMRVSTKDQNEARQVKELLEFGINERDIYLDKQSGKNFARENYLLLRDRQLRKGDLLVITSIDRFGRNYQEILEEWRYITKVIGADIHVLDMPILDTRQRGGAEDPMGSLINDIILQLLSYVADRERTNIRQRQREGIIVAQEKGIRFGRPIIEFPEGWDDLFEKWKAQEIRTIDFYQQLGIRKSTFYVMVERYEKLQKEFGNVGSPG